MDKPVSMSVKDYLIRILAVKSMTSEKVIEAVVAHQFQSANEALQKNNTVEISGFGKFIFNVNKANKKLEMFANVQRIQNAVLADEAATEAKKQKAMRILNDVQNSVQLIKDKLKEGDEA
jgi:nucleoid DNA-binding protein